MHFELQITLEDGSFGGIATDPEFSILSIVPVLVKGQLEGDHIRFIKTYLFWCGVGGVMDVIDSFEKRPIRIPRY
ncbi:MAG: hypothetical protein P8M19_06060 [Crocinitomicaceae bacterium]|nr:hypothetical protein [Crocinitomicaceae bacterium]MDG1658860.1 hypothetical protein [Crocinitomicaceae bacterium]MDG2441216.1 hypothetical protein [Crocinitomicaceae bacterium]